MHNHAGIIMQHEALTLSSQHMLRAIVDLSAFSYQAEVVATTTYTKTLCSDLVVLQLMVS